MAAVSAKSIQSILDFATHLASSLQQNRPLYEACRDIDLYISALPFSPKNLSNLQKSLLRENAVAIWNVCNVMVDFKSRDPRPMEARLRTFVYLLLANNGSATKRKCATRQQILRTALHAAKSCLQNKLDGFAAKIIEGEASNAAALKEEVKDSDGREQDVGLLIEYTCLRLLFDHQRSRLDLANRTYSELEALTFPIQDSAVETISHLLYQIGDDELKQHKAKSACKWLERALAWIEQGQCKTYFDGSDLRLNILHTLIRASREVDETLFHERAIDLLDQLKAEYGQKLAVILLSLDVSLGQPPEDTRDVVDQVETLIRVVHLIESNHRLVMSYISKLSGRDPGAGIKFLKDYVVRRLIPEGYFEWTEKAIIWYLSLVTQSSQPSGEVVACVREDLDLFESGLSRSLGIEACQAGYALIWKAIRDCDKAGIRSVAVLWCQLGQHDLLNAVGETNLAKLERRLISYHLLVSNYCLGQELLDRMSFAQRSNKHSKYLAYCLAVRTGNDEEADSCLNTMVNGQGNNQDILLACVGESLQNGKPLHTVKLLQRLLDNYTSERTKDVDIGSLLQYTAQMLVGILVDIEDGQGPGDVDLLVRLCVILRQMIQFCSNPGQFDEPGGKKDVIAWFAKMSFEITMSHVKIWPRRFCIDLFQYSTELEGFANGDVPDVAMSKTKRIRRRDAMFTQTLLYSLEARNLTPEFSLEDLPQTSFDKRDQPKSSKYRLLLFQNVFRIFAKTRERYQQNAPFAQVDDDDDEKVQLEVLVPLAFEALIYMNADQCLSNDSSFDEISIKELLVFAEELSPPASTYALLADTILRFSSGGERQNSYLDGVQIPSMSAARLLGHIIRNLRPHGRYNVGQAARWIRCVVQLVLNAVEDSIPKVILASKPRYEQNLNMLDSIIKQVPEMVSAASASGLDPLGNAGIEAEEKIEFPIEELQWLATKLFNLAVDLHQVQQEALARKWSAKAIEIAGLMGDGYSALVELLQSKAEALGWSESD